MSSMCIRDCILHGKETSICIEDHLITEIGRKMEADTTIDARGKMALPGMVNAHTHAAMSLLKGYADDMELMPWLENKIWPIEALLKPEHIYWGSRLACLEMIKTGTTAFNDMYFMMEETARAAQDSGIRAVLGNGFIDLFNDEKREGEIRCTENLVRHIESLNSPLLKASIAPHAIYTVSDQGLSWCAEYAREKELPLHIHLSETEKEVKDCAASRGSSPVRHLERIGFLGKNVIAAHSVWLDPKDMEILAKHAVKPCHNPVSNMKLSVGRAMPFREMRRVGLKPALGTDGSASNNSLDMFESMKFAALLQKFAGSPTDLPHEEALLMATRWGAEALGIRTGSIEPEMDADIVLMDAERYDMVPSHNPLSNIVYSAKGTAVTHTICRGRLIMEDRKVDGEEVILEKAHTLAMELAKRASE